MKHSIIFFILLLQWSLHAQSDSTRSTLAISGYVEPYYSFDLVQPDGHQRQPFVYAYNRHNEFNLNLGFVKAAFSDRRSRANLALMAGTYANDNLAAEPGVLKNILEANAGFKISKQHNLWVDAGIFSSHIGFESAVGKDCWNLTRSMLADNSPYFESGAKITYTSADEKWLLTGLLLNGWQRIQRVPGNNTPAFGHQLTYKPNASVTLNSSSFIGNDKADSLRQMRYFHNLYGIFQLNAKTGLTLGLDMGAEQKPNRENGYNTWIAPVAIVKYSATQHLKVAARVESYVDQQGVIIATGTPNGFQTLGYSINVDYLIQENMMWRIEARGLHSKDLIFVLNDQPSNNNFFFTSSLAISF